MPEPARPRRGAAPLPADLDSLLPELCLAPPDELARAADGGALLRGLVEAGRLTPWQADELAAGRGRELVLGNYFLMEKLGEGGMGQVFKALHRNLDRTDAVKVIRANVVADPEAVARFRREARAAARLGHPHLVTVHDAGEAGGRHYLAMEYVEGADLARLVQRRGPLPGPAVCRMLYQAALGLQHAHERGLVHRDVKPANLLLSAQGKVKLLDLGLASLRGDEVTRITRLTSAYRVMGTPDFMAPEQTVSAGAVDGRADLYSLGCTAYYLLAGHVPFPGGDALEKLLRQRLEPPRALEEVRPVLPPVLCGVVARLMAKAPEDRYQTAGELAEALRPLLKTGPRVPPPPEGPPTIVPQPTARWQRPLASARPPRLWRGRGVRYGVVLVAAVLLAFTTVTFWPSGPPGGKGPPPKGTEKTEGRKTGAPPVSAPLRWRVGKTFPVGTGSVFSVLFLPGDRYLAAAGADSDRPLNTGTLDLLDMHDGKVTSLSRDGPALRCLGLLDRGRTLVVVTGSCSDRGPVVPGQVQFWDLQSRKRGRALDARVTAVSSLAVAPDGRWLAVAGREGGVERIDLPGGRRQWVIPAEGAPATWGCLALSGDGRRLACGSSEGALRVFETAGWKPVFEYAPPPADRAYLGTMAFRPGGRELAGVGGVPKGRSAMIQLWDVDKKERKWGRRHGEENTFSLVLAADGRTLATGDRPGTVRLWDLETRGLLAELADGDDNPIWSLSFTSDGRTLAAGRYDGTVRLFHGEQKE